MKPRVKLTDPAFKYKNAASTDIRLTFAKERRRLALAAAREKTENVTQLRKVKA